MIDAAALLHRLRSRVQLPPTTFAMVEQALRSGHGHPEEVLLQAGLTFDQISALLEEDDSSSPIFAPSGHAEDHTSVTTVVEEPSVDELISRLVDITPRFELQGEIARGAMGRILAAWDLHLGRPVAIKILRKSSARDLDRVRFLEEAQVTGQLQHPNVMPVYELGRLRDQVAFVMRRIEGRSLKDVISGLRRNEPQIEQQFGPMRLLNVFHQLCLAVAYAHTRQVVHRDLKPSNVMLGDFGEVVLLDWGLCKIIGAATRSTRSTSERWKTVHGQIIGTPAYMAPEQAMGMIDQVDQRTDVYGLGAILYHLLTLRPPFAGKSNREIVNRVLKERVVSPQERAPERVVPPELEQICLRCLARDQAERYPNARALAEAIRGFLDSPTSGGAPPSLAGRGDALLKKGMQAITRHESLLEDAALVSDEMHTAWARLEPTDPPEVKTTAWRAEMELKRLHVQISETFAQAVQALTEAVALAPDNVQARRMLCDLYLTRHEQAQSRGEEGRAAYYRRMLSLYDDGRYAQLCAGEGSLHAELTPQGARVWIWRYGEQAPRLVEGEPQDLGPAPVKIDQLPAGIYRLAAQAPDRETLSTTVVVEPGRCARLRLRMLRAGMVPAGFVHVPAGTFRFGSTRHPYLPPMEQALPDFLIAVVPVTAALYLDFVNTLARTTPGEALRRVPRTHDGRRPLWRIDGRGVYSLPEDEGWTPDTPVVGITAEDAQAYCRWRGEQEGVSYRLPTEEEWEKAARGTEGRVFPWGSSFEPSFTACPATWRGPWPPPVGRFGYDCSPYGVRDLAGGVREWTSTNAFGRTARRVVRGGSFLTGNEQGRPLWTREIVPTDRTAPDIGFRLARDPVG
ncbi:MAG: SUMF1/EgtB/PvdO family nonheme iron enzyme [Myxococcales bacterium]|nr:SUMF1/EgtB/PvdO family nonheme iron enzyme [Myxococcales bacterium]